jgi:hypothetical protein
MPRDFITDSPISSSNYDKELSLTGERGITKSASKNPQVRRSYGRIQDEVDTPPQPAILSICVRILDQGRNERIPLFQLEFDRAISAH